MNLPICKVKGREDASDSPRYPPRSCWKTVLQCDATALLYLSSGHSVTNVIGVYTCSENSETHIMLGCAHGDM